MDVKCAYNHYAKNLVYYKAHNGCLIENAYKDVYIQAHLIEEDRERERAAVVLIGYTLREDLGKCRITRGKRGNGHMNIELCFEDSHPIQRLISHIRRYQEKTNGS
jgi:hypothetical protein